MQQYSREDKIFALATLLSERRLTPNDNLYKSVIVKVCAANFQMAKAQVDDLTKILTAAYRADRWQHILDKVTAPPEPGQLTSYLTLKQAAKNTVATLKHMAYKDTFDGVGRLILKEVQVELGPITAEEILETWQKYNLKDTIQQEGNVFLVYWGGKENLEEKRGIRPTQWNPQRPTLTAEKEYHTEQHEKNAEYPDTKTGDVAEDDSGVVNEEETGEG